MQSQPFDYPDTPPQEPLPGAENPSPTLPEVPPSPPPSRFAAWRDPGRELIETILLTLVIFFMIRFAVENFRIEGSSMEPNFHDGQFLLVNKLAYRLGQPQRGDVIVFHFPLNVSQNFIKRVIGVPGDTVQVRAGAVYVNGTRLDERDCTQPLERGCIIEANYPAGPVTLGPDEYYVLGDNRPESSDSHVWGTVPAQNIIGKTWVTYWPPDEWGPVPAYPTQAAP